MEIKINLPEYQCDDLLAMHGFISEEITAYYSPNENPYNEDTDVVGTLYPIKVRVAYHPMSKPKELEEEHPMFEKVKEFEYENVINELFNSHIWDLIVGD